jgi:hypothetical protein
MTDQPEITYTEIEGDTEGRVLEMLAERMPYAFVVATSLEPLNIRVASHNDVEVIRALLTQTLHALPGSED